MNWLIGLALRQRLVILFIVGMVALIGARTLPELPIDAVPDVTNVQVQILSNGPGMAPQEVEQQITFPVEAALSGLPHLEQVRSVSRFGMSAITAVFEEGTDIFLARQLIQERIAILQGELKTTRPEMGPISTGLGEIYQFEVRGEPMCPAGSPDLPTCYSPMELRELLDHYISYQLRAVPGVVELNGYGGEVKTYEVSVDPQALTALGVGLNQVFDALAANNENVGGGYLVHAGEQRIIRGEARITSLEEIRQIPVVTSEEGTPILVRDLADVHFGGMIRAGAVTRDGNGETVVGIVMMLLGANSREVALAVDQAVIDLGPSLPPGVTIDTFYDRSTLVDRTISTVAKNLLEGGALVIIVLLLLLGEIRGGLLVASAIPLSMLATVIAMKATGLSGNLMSLGALDFGLIVDASVVMVEQVIFALAHTKAKGDGVLAVIRQSASHVARPVSFAVAIIVLVFVPVLTLQGIEGKMFRPMALTVIFALLSSLVLALTFMPAMASIIFRSGAREHEPWLMRMARQIYQPVLLSSLRHRNAIIAVNLLMLGFASWRATQLGMEFLPRLDESAIAIQTTRLAAVSLEESIEMCTRTEQVLRDAFPSEIETIVSKTGRPEIATDPMGVETSDLYIGLHPQDQWKEVHNTAELVAAMEATLLREVPGQAYLFSQPIELRTNELISGTRADVALSIFGPDLDVLAARATQASQIIANIEGAADVSVEQVSGLPFVRVQVDRTALARYGVPAQHVLNAVESLAGVVVGSVQEGTRKFDLQVRIDSAYRQNITDLEQIPIAANDGHLVALRELAQIKIEDGPAQISREAISRKITVQANVRGRDLASFVAQAQDDLASNMPPEPGYFFRWGGQFRNLEAALDRLAIAVPAALSLIFLLLYLAFGSLRPALLVYLNVPFATIGGVLALDLRGMPFSISASVGFIALSGIAMLNGVVLVSEIRERQHQGKDRQDATREGALARLRPVLMTALVASLGFLPMALATSAGAEVQRPLATVVIGGLFTSTLLTLLVLPVLYAWLGEAKIHPGKSAT